MDSSSTHTWHSWTSKQESILTKCFLTETDNVPPHTHIHPDVKWANIASLYDGQYGYNGVFTQAEIHHQFEEMMWKVVRFKAKYERLKKNYPDRNEKTLIEDAKREYLATSVDGTPFQHEHVYHIIKGRPLIACFISGASGT